MVTKDKCYYCGEKVKARGLCNSDYTYIYRTFVGFPNMQEIINELRARDQYKKDFIYTEKCYFCGDPVDCKGLCRKHYKTCRTYNVNTSNKEEALAFLNEQTKFKQIVYCYVCAGKKHLKGLCKRHYVAAAKRNLNFDNLESIIDSFERSPVRIIK